MLHVAVVFFVVESVGAKVESLLCPFYTVGCEGTFTYQMFEVRDSFCASLDGGTYGEALYVPFPFGHCFS